MSIEFQAVKETQYLNWRRESTRDVAGQARTCHRGQEKWLEAADAVRENGQGSI